MVTEPAELTSQYHVRDTVTWGFFVALALAVAATVYATAQVAPDIHGESSWSSAIFATPAAVTALSTFELCWRGTEAYVLQFAFRLYAVTPVAAVLCFIALLITTGFVPIEYDRNGFHYLFGDGSLWLVPLAMLLFCWLAAVAVFLVIVLPFLALLKPRIAIAGNLLSTRPEHDDRNRRAMRGLAVLLVLVFLIPSLIVFGNMLGNPLAVWVGVGLIPLGVFLAAYVAILQRKPTFLELFEDGAAELKASESQTERPVE